ncbi:MAG: ribosomal RNA small subunit methyltransferase A [Clostridia bacterium]|nr:ribosomal RNA small subunit methyltransferase A [Clostridia bacterium]
MNLCNLGEVRTLLEKHGIAPRKSYGQNFLVNSAIPEEIADTSAYAPFLFPENESDNAHVLEIGPGIGALTRELAARYPAVTAVEIDDGLIPVLAETLADLENVRVIHSDFLKTDTGTLIEELSGGVPVHICANLPYYVTTPILQKLLDTFLPDGTSPLRRITLLVQSEFADRVCATAEDKDYSATSVLTALHGRARRMFSVSAGNFYPVPKVSSAVLSIEPYPNGLWDLWPDAPRGEDFPPYFQKLTKVIDASFLQRRKALPNALSPLFSKADTENALTKMGIRTDVRGEKLSPEDFCRLTALLTTK